MIHRRHLALLATLVAAPTVLAAQTGGAKAAAQTSSLALVIEGGVELGGDQIVELLFTNGGSQKLTAGQGGTIAAGLQYQPASIPRLSVAATVGYKFVTNASNNSSIGLTRVPIELVGRWQLAREWSLGGGVVRHAAVRFNGDGLLPDADLSASTGATVEVGWRWAALTYTAMNYTGPNGKKLNAGSVGATVRWVYRRK